MSSEEISPPTTFNFADIWEAVSPLCADRTAVVCGDTRLTYAELEQRANRLANALASRGVGRGDHVALYLENSPEYLESMLAAYKLRAVPINVNYRYVEHELIYLFNDSDSVAVIHHRQFSERMANIREAVPGVRFALSVDDGSSSDFESAGSESYEAVLTEASPERAFGPRSSTDTYVLYTGGTTGMPKGVVWHQIDAFYACIGGGDPMRLSGVVTEPHEMMDRILDGAFVYLPVAPLMHAAGQWTAFSWLFSGGTIVLLPGSLDPADVWTTIGREGVNLITVVGDAVVRPLVDEWERSGPYEIGSLFSIGSGGAPLTPKLKSRLTAALPNVIVVDGFGSSETGAQGTARSQPGEQADGPPRFAPYTDTTTVLDADTLEEVQPGSGKSGRVALRGRIPQGYYNDPEKTAATFVEAGGHRWVLTGDIATLEADGTINLLGRGSGCINTGGEKVFPEEVESTLKEHPGVYDALVVGVDDDRWGQRVVAVYAPTPDGAASDAAEPEVTEPDGEALAEHCRGLLAGYKVPKQFHRVDAVRRTPAGKPDYRWAKEVATEAQ